MNEQMKQTTIGVEVEFTGITRAKAANIVAGVLNGTVYYVGGTYDKYEVTGPDGRRWTLMYDSSIKAEKLDGTDEELIYYKVEFVTPVMTYEKDIKTFQNCISELRKAGGKANHSTGIHVHIDGANHTVKSLTNWINLISQRQDLLVKALDVWTNRQDYCKNLPQKLIDKVNTNRPATMSELADIWYKTLAPHDNRTIHYNRSRYHALNLHSYFNMSHHTVEIRAFNGSMHAGKIRAYIALVLAMNYQALTSRRINPAPVYGGNDKFAMRTWLNRIGFIGDEMKNCRMHLMKNLEGCAAWRFRTAT